MYSYRKYLPAITLSVLLLSLSAFSCGRVKRNSGGDSTRFAEGSAVQVIAMSDSLLQYRGADTVDMGRIKSGETVVKNSVLFNAGDKPLVVIAVDKSCGCVEVEYPKNPLKPGEKSDMEISFDSKGLSGFVYKTVAVRTSLGVKPYTLVVTADVE